MKNKQRCNISKSTENAEKREENGRRGKHGKEKKINYRQEERLCN